MTDARSYAPSRARQQWMVVIVIATGVVVAITVLVAGAAAGYRLNMTPSEPLGVWRIRPLERPPAVGDLVFICPPETEMFSEARARGYLRRGVCPTGDAPLIFCSKGMEAESFAFPVDMAHEAFPARPRAVLSGPTFAHEVAAGLPTAITLAADDPALAEALARALARPHFRPYASTDVIGAEIGGAVKNILAIACGIVDGAGLGLNARAALISRGFAEMARFGLARGAQAETLAGLAGLGDLVLTCTSSNSRNFALGQGLGRGEAAETLMADRRTVAEGAFSAPVVAAAARADGIDMPITETVARLVAGEVRVADAIQALLSRPLRPEGR